MSRSVLVWQKGVVVACADGAVRVRFESLSHCQRCLRGEGCGAGVFSRLFAGRRAELKLATDRRFEVGERVRVGITSATLVRLAALIYGLPVVVFILAAAAAASLLPAGGREDLVSLLVGCLSAAVAIAAVTRGRRWMLNPRLEALSATAGCRTVESGTH